MKIGFIFPGQGSQTVGMGKDLYDKYDEIKKIYNRVSEISGKDIAKLTFSSSEEELSETKNAQIAILTMSLGILEVLNKYGIEAKISAGLSLGEYTALIYSGSFSFENGIKIVEKRGEIMQNNIPKGDWMMAGILGLDDKIVEEICKNVNSGFVRPVNYNCPGQVVISGDKIAVEEAGEKAKQAGVRKVSVLRTKGPFHTEKLNVASEKIKLELKKSDVKIPNKRVIKNLDGKEYKENDNMIEILYKHVINPVKFSSCIQTMINGGIDTFVEIGPGKVLTGLVKRINREVKLINIYDCDTLENAIKQLKNS